MRALFSRIKPIPRGIPPLAPRLVDGFPPSALACSRPVSSGVSVLHGHCPGVQLNVLPSLGVLSQQVVQ